MALPATDVFTGTNNTQLPTYSANWTLQNGDFDIQSNGLCADVSGTECAAFWDADVFNNDQYAQVVIAAQSSAIAGVGVACRVDTGTTNNWYGAYTINGTVSIFKHVSGSATQLGSGLTGWLVNDVLRLETQGTTVRVKRVRSGTTTTEGTYTDSALASGAAGVSGFHDSTSSRIDNWEGGNIGGATSYSLTADAGAFTVSGTAAGLLFGSEVAADSGAYLIAGTDAALSRTWEVAADPGAVVVAGTDATFRRGYALTAEPGAFAVSGTDASLEYGREVPAESGAYVIAGTDATLIHGTPGQYTMAAEGGAFVVSGTSAELLRALRLQADAAAYSILGTAADLLAGRTMAADGGAYVISGTAATLRWSGEVIVSHLTGILTVRPALLGSLTVSPALTGTLTVEPE